MNRFACWLTAILVCAYVAPAAAQLDDDRYGPSIIASDEPQRPAGTYIVQDGDTLWDLSEQVFGDAFFWPTLWSYNPQVTNPHWIYPGDLIYLKRRQETAAANRVVFARSRYTSAPKLIDVLARFKGFVNERRYKESGRIEFSREEKTMLGEHDETYVRFTIPKRILPGEEFTIYRPLREIRHPVTKKRLGWLTKHLGIARVLNVDRKKTYVKALILQSYEEINRGDLLTKRVWDQELVVPVENKVSAWARVVDSFKGINQMGEFDYTIVDKGFKQKIRRGNRFVIRRRGDGVSKLKKHTLAKMPWENYGEVMVVEPFENTSLAIVTRSIQEINSGDVLELIRGY